MSHRKRQEAAETAMNLALPMSGHDALDAIKLEIGGGKKGEIAANVLMWMAKNIEQAQTISRDGLKLRRDHRAKLAGTELMTVDEGRAYESHRWPPETHPEPKGGDGDPARKPASLPRGRVAPK